MNLSYYQPDEEPFGCTYGNWTVKWWQWLLSKSMANNPANDKTGINNNSAAQNDKNVWFLAGTFDGMDVAHREVEIPSDRAILLPAICYQANFVEDPIFKDKSELEKHVRDDIDNIVEALVTVDDTKIDTFRIMSDPITFPLKVPKDIPHGKHTKLMKKMLKDEDTKAVAEGYWAFLKPLSPGLYDLHLKGSSKEGNIGNEVFYKINVSNDK